jgi:hypothetical protein
MVVLAWLLAFKLGVQGVPRAYRGMQWLLSLLSSFPSVFSGGSISGGNSSTSGERDKGDVNTNIDTTSTSIDAILQQQPKKRRVLTQKCILCMDHLSASGSLPPPASTTCGHLFCLPCLTQWLELQPRCPVCRTPQLPQQVRILYNL